MAPPHDRRTTAVADAVVLPPERLALLRQGAAVVTAAPAVFEIAGSGALTCLQGLLTNDVDKPGDRSVVYGALLTPKGMIVVDLWALREAGEGEDRFLLVAPRAGREAALAIFRRSLPPRLARLTDRTDEVHAAWCVGAHSFQMLARAGLGPLPEACGRASTLDLPGGRVTLALGTEPAWFTALLLGGPGALASALGVLRTAGAVTGEAEDLAAARILAGWPALGAEIDERTLPQEVRYDAIGGVSYTKGCYTGQETVARVHFRGHVNRELRGLRWAPGAVPEGPDATVLHGEREVGTVRSMLTVGTQTVGLAPLRREVAAGDAVVAAGRPATVVALPFAANELLAG